MTYIEGCKIAEEIVNADSGQLIGRDMKKHVKAGVGYVITKYNGTFQSVNLTDGTEFYLNHKARVCEMRKARAAGSEAVEPMPVTAPEPSAVSEPKAAAFEIVSNKSDTAAEPTTTPKENAMTEQNTAIDPAVAAEYREETTQLTAALNAFITRLKNDKQVSEQALRNFIENPLDSKTISYHAARLSYTKEMLDQLHKVAEMLPH